MRVPFCRFRWSVELGEHSEPLDWALIPETAEPIGYGDLRTRRDEIMEAWERHFGETLYPVENHIGRKVHLAGVYGKDFTAARNAKAAIHNLKPDQLAWSKEAYRTTGRNARDRGIEFGLTANQIARLLLRAKGKCEVTGIEFSYDRGAGFRAPWRPSIDRIDSARGYTPKNCRIVCCAVNLAMNEWGIQVLDKLARAYVSRADAKTLTTL